MAAAAAAARTVSLWIFFFFCSLVSFSFFLLIRCLCHQVHQRKHGFYRLRRCYCCCFVSFFTGYTNGEGGEDVTCKTIGDCTHRHDQSCSEDTRWRLKGIECNVKREDLPIFFLFNAARVEFNNDDSHLKPSPRRGYFFYYL